MERQRVQRQPERSETEEIVETGVPSAETSVDLDEVDALLDEIDQILEENPQEFVDAYQQKGGQ